MPKTDPEINVLGVSGQATIAVPGRLDGGIVQGVEFGTVTRSGVTLAAGAVISIGEQLTFSPSSSGGTTYLNVRLNNREFSGRYGDLDEKPPSSTSLDTEAVQDIVAAMLGDSGVYNDATGTYTITPASGGGGQSARWLGLPSPVSASASKKSIYGAQYGWTRRTVHVAGIRVYADIPLSALSSINVTRSDGSQKMLWLRGSPGITRITGSDDTGDYTDFLFPQPALVSNGRLGIGFDPPYSVPVGTVPTPLPDGMTFTITDDGGTDLNNMCIPMAPLSSEPIELPIVPVPSNPSYGINSDLDMHSEIVWPASGNPYLHVYKAQEESSPSKHFHVPLTSGLP